MTGKLRRLLGLLIALALLLTACAAPPVSETVYEGLPPASSPYSAPVGDGGLSYTETVALHLPNRSGQRLIVQYEEVPLRHDEHPARAILEALLSYPANDDVRALNTGSSAELALHGAVPVEVSGGVCTVNLASSALQLSYASRYTLCLSIAATLGELPDIDAVNVLIADQAIALEITSCLPLGAISADPGEELSVLWEQMEARRAPLGQAPSGTPVIAAATLYFPLADGSGFMPETRTMSFPGQDPRQLALELVNALSAGAQYVNGAADMPNLGVLLNVDPIVTDLEDGGRMLTLRFNAGLEDHLRTLGLKLDVFLGALQRTLCTFIPSISAMQVYVSDALLTSLYSESHGSRLFPGGVMQRSQFDQYLMQHITLYFARDGHLSPVLRSVPQAQSRRLRSLLTLLSEGPSAAELESGFSPTLPGGLHGSDILGLGLADGTLLVNLSGQYARHISGQTMDETLLCYSLVNTLCQALSIQRIRFYFDSDMAGQLSGNIYWGGEFLQAPGLIR